MLPVVCMPSYHGDVEYVVSHHTPRMSYVGDLQHVGILWWGATMGALIRTPWGDTNMQGTSCGGDGT